MPEQIAIEVGVPDGITDDEWAAFIGTVNLAVVAYAKDKFESENNDWPATAWPRIAEFVADLDDGQVRPRSMDPSHQTGVGTGRMRDAISTVVPQGITVGETTLQLVYGADYAERFHRGGDHIIEIDRRGLKQAYARQSDVRSFIREHRLGWLFAKESFTLTQQPRPLFDVIEIQDLVRAEAAARWPEAN